MRLAKPKDSCNTKGERPLKKQHLWLREPSYMQGGHDITSISKCFCEIEEYTDSIES